jgi:hypothetical protein
MSDYSWSVVSAVMYRIATIAAGLLTTWMGYELFKLGVYEKAGELKATWGSRALLVKQAAPGTFFALFGTGVMAVSVWKGIDISRIKPSQTPFSVGTVATPQQEGSVSPIFTSPPNAGEIEPIISKAEAGKSLSEDEQKRLREWFREQKQFNDSWHIEVNQPQRDSTKQTG